MPIKDRIPDNSHKVKYRTRSKHPVLRFERSERELRADNIDQLLLKLRICIRGNDILKIWRPRAGVEGWEG